jgi:hypothetical protein
LALNPDLGASDSAAVLLGGGGRRNGLRNRPDRLVGDDGSNIFRGLGLRSRGGRRIRAFDRLIDGVDGVSDTFVIDSKRRLNRFYRNAALEEDIPMRGPFRRDTFAYIKGFELGVDRLKVPGSKGRGGAYVLRDVDDIAHIRPRITGLALVHRRNPDDVLAVLKGFDASMALTPRDLF